MANVTSNGAVAFLQQYDVHPTRGFLPNHDPLTSLPAAFAPWEDLARHLPKLLVAGNVRQAIGAMPLLDAARLSGQDEIQRAMLLLSYFGHAYVFCEEPPAATLPANIAIPWHDVAEALGRPPVLSYASHALYNWRRLDAEAPIDLGNIARLENFLGGMDEDWFVLVHVAIEGKSGSGLLALAEAQEAVAADRPDDFARHLDVAATALATMLATLRRMPEKCDPYIYYTRVRQFIFGWKDNPALPDGVFYEGVVDYAGRPQTFRGETGAQSSIIPAFDNALGMNYDGDELGNHLLALRDYMPPRHREFVVAMAQRPAIRAYVCTCKAEYPEAVDAYNRCVDLIGQFRQQHLEYAGTYIHAQSQRVNSNPVDVGTGGTPFMRYLKQHARDVAKYTIA